MAKAHHEKIIQTGELLLDKIRESADDYTAPDDCHALAQAFATVVEAMPRDTSAGGEGKGRNVW
ncbi:hypothetical protein ACQBAT_07800 [Ornithinimicrobium sp. Y1847]|uniref:hypothetical protein n=1 Tax=unclassified Ornithinimicrobium TaxID=2615080 RepID=UPI003B682C49